MKKSLFKVLSTIVTIFVTIASLTPQYFATGSVFTNKDGNLSATITNQYTSNSAYMLTLMLTKTFEYSDELNEDTLPYFENFKDLEDEKAKEKFSNIFEIQRNTTSTNEPNWNDETNWNDFVDFNFADAKAKPGEKSDEDSKKTYSIVYTLQINSPDVDNSQYSFRVREKDLSKISDIKDSFSSDNMCKEGNEDVWVEFKSDPAAPNDVKTALITNTHIPGQQKEEFKITYKSGTDDVEGNPPTDDKTYKNGSNATILGKGTLEREGYKFIGWATKAKAEEAEYTEDEEIPITKDVTLYPVWRLLTTSDLSVQIKYGFSANGNITIGASGDYELDGETLTVPEDAKTYKLNDTVNLKNAPSVSGYSFDGWRLEGKNGSTKKLGASFEITQKILDEYAKLSDDFKEETDEPETSGTDKKSDTDTSGADKKSDADTSGTDKKSDADTSGTDKKSDADTSGTDKKSDADTSGADKKSDADTSGSSDLEVSLLPIKNTAYLSVQSSSSNKVYILALVGSYSKNSTSSSDSSSPSPFVYPSNPNSKENAKTVKVNTVENAKEITVNFIHKYFSLDKDGNEISDGEYKSSAIITNNSNINIKDHIKETFNEVPYRYIGYDPEIDDNILTFDKAKDLAKNGQLTITLTYKIANGELSLDSELKSGVGGENIAEDVAEENLESGDINLISDDTVNTGKYMFIIPFIAIIAAAVYAIAFMNKKTL